MIVIDLVILPAKANKKTRLNLGYLFVFRNVFGILTSDELSQQIHISVNCDEKILWKTLKKLVIRLGHHNIPPIGNTGSAQNER